MHSGDPAPEHRTCPADCDRRGDTDNISRPDRRRQRCRKCRVGSIIFPGKTKPDPTWDLTLDKPQTKCKIQMCSQKKQNLPRGSKLTGFLPSTLKSPYTDALVPVYGDFL